MTRIKYFFWGILASAMSLVAQSFVLIVSGNNYLPRNFWEEVTFFLAIFVFIEEWLKFIFLKKIIFEEKEGFWGVVLLGLGFSALEILFNLPVFQNTGADGVSRNFFPLLSLLVVHLATSLLAGWILRSKKTPVSFWRQAETLALVFCLHFLYNIAIIKMV